MEFSYRVRLVLPPVLVAKELVASVGLYYTPYTVPADGPGRVSGLYHPAGVGHPSGIGTTVVAHTTELLPAYGQTFRQFIEHYRDDRDSRNDSEQRGEP